MNPYESLLARIKLVRRRWRTQALVKGISLFLVSAAALLVLGVWGADLFGFKPLAVWTARVAAAGAILFAAWRFIYRALAARAGDVQIAQLIEEKYPRLEDRLVAAVEHGERDAAASSMIDLLIRDALEKTGRVDLSIFTNRRRLAYFGLLGSAACLALLALLIWGPAFFPYGFSHLYAPWTEASIGSSMRIKIDPGDIEIAKGSDQLIQAQLVGFDSPDAQLFLQPDGAAGWNASAMEPNPRGSGFRHLLLDIQVPLRYYAEAKGVRSQIHSVRVIDLARVNTIKLTYNFPAYTGMSPQTVENEGDISALKGTKINLEVGISRPAQSARLFFDNGTALELAPSGPQSFSGSFGLLRSGAYVVQLTDARARNYAGSREYEMEALEDAEPKVTVIRPMRDVRATSVEEVFSEIKAEDDIGLSKLELRYAVNGGPEKTVPLYGGKPPELSVAGSHTFFLEDFGLQPGDMVSYYGTAWDNNNVTGPGTASSDIYFIQIRPFEQKYTQSQQSGQMGESGEGQEGLSLQQKEIISATFKLIREKARMQAKEYSDDLKSLALVQSKLQAQTQGLVDRLKRRGAEQADESFRQLSEYLKNAVEEMSQAAANLGAEKPNSALPQEQKALQQLMRAESLFRDIQVSFAAQNAGSGRSQANAEDLADLFELEMNQLKNQYETIQRGEQQARDQKVDEALQRLKELAQRQQQLNERNRMLGQQRGSSSASGGSQSQQQLLEQAEQLRRQLQRLSRERSSPSLDEAGRQLERAVEEMKKALSGSQRGDSAEANAQGMRALQQLNEAARKLARSQEAGLSRGLDQAVDESRKMVQEQAGIQQGVERLAKENLAQSGSAGETAKQGEEIISRKTVLADRLKNLQGRIQDLSQQARKAQKETGSKLADAAGGIRDKRLPERIMSGNALIQNQLYEPLKQREDYIRGGLEDLAQQLESARDSLGQSREGKMEEAAGRARQLAEGLESMRQRMSGAQSGRPEQGQERGQRGGRSERPQSAQQSGGRDVENPERGAPSAQGEVGDLSRDAAAAPSGIGANRDEAGRQWARELKQRMADAQDLGRLLDRNTAEMRNLENAIESLRRAGDYQDYRNPEQIESLRAAIDYMRKVELELARALDRLGRDEKHFFSEDNEAPAGYRKLVDEYYKAIAKTR